MVYSEGIWSSFMAFWFLLFFFFFVHFFPLEVSMFFKITLLIGDGLGKVDFNRKRVNFKINKKYKNIEQSTRVYAAKFLIWVSYFHHLNIRHDIKLCQNVLDWDCYTRPPLPFYSSPSVTLLSLLLVQKFVFSDFKFNVTHSKARIQVQKSKTYSIIITPSSLKWSILKVYNFWFHTWCAVLHFIIFYIIEVVLYLSCKQNKLMLEKFLTICSISNFSNDFPS